MDRRREIESGPISFGHGGDDHAAPGGTPFLEMVIECKRLGDSDLCRLYVAKGVTRFQNDEHAYAKHMRSAFMVGYLQGVAVNKAKQRVSQGPARPRALTAH